ncbi:hypothetical protein HY967_01145 [Candidatus Jorgensenbacteria bacterium]|nr:hypothetical protein [Candidatus Jorgensenbacteria bacterium]
MALDKTKIQELLKIDLLKELNLDGLPLGEKLGLMDDMARLVIEGVWIKILENLTATQRDELETLFQSGAAQETIIAFIQKAVPNYQDLAMEEVASYKDVLLSGVKGS